MNIDIFTFSAQIINFLILLFILNKLVYKPIIKAMKDRNNKIQKTISDAESKFKEAEETKTKYEEELKNIENYKEEQKSIIDNNLLNYREEEIQKIKDYIKGQKDVFLAQLENDKTMIIDEMIKKFYFYVDDFLGEIFSSLSDSSLNSSILNKFMLEIKNISNEDLEKINKSTTKTIDFISSYKLSEEEKNLVKDTFKIKGIIYENLNFVVDENILLGNRFITEGIVINSNIKNVIDNFIVKLKSVL